MIILKRKSFALCNGITLDQIVKKTGLPCYKSDPINVSKERLREMAKRRELSTLPFKAEPINGRSRIPSFNNSKEKLGEFKKKNTLAQ